MASVMNGMSKQAVRAPASTSTFDLSMLMLPDAWPAPASVSHHQVSTGVTSEQIQHLSQTDAIIRIKRLNDPLSPVFGAEKSVLKIVTFVN